MRHTAAQFLAIISADGDGDGDGEGDALDG